MKSQYYDIGSCKTRVIRSLSPVLWYPLISWSFPLFLAPRGSGSSRLLASLWLLSICSVSSSRRGGPVSTEHDLAETEMGLSFPELPPSFLFCLFLYSAEALESFCSVPVSPSRGLQAFYCQVLWFVEGVDQGLKVILKINFLYFMKTVTSVTDVLFIWTKSTWGASIKPLM